MKQKKKNVKHKKKKKTIKKKNPKKHLVIRKAVEQLLKWDGHSASLDKTKYTAEGNADSLRVATKSCNK